VASIEPTQAVAPTQPAIETIAGVPINQHSSPQLIIPTTPVLEKKTYAATLSYVGITRRTTAWVRKVGTSPAVAALAWGAAVTFLLFMYVFLVFWYLVTGFFFGWLMIPFRLVRRSHRKQAHLQQTQLATMQAMLVQQQQQMIRNERSS
jgi:hypothetical protein